MFEARDFCFGEATPSTIEISDMIAPALIRHTTTLSSFIKRPSTD